MSFPTKVLENNKDAKTNLLDKVTTLNPNAAEFVPSVLRSTYGNSKSADASKLDVPEPSGKAVLGRSESAISNNSDDEAHQYWRRQLPDDITPDFKVMVEAELPGLSIRDGTEISKFSASVASQTWYRRQDRSPLGIDNHNFSRKLKYSGPTISEDQSAAFSPSAANSWGKQFVHGDQQFTSGIDGHHHDGDFSTGFVHNLSSHQPVIVDASIRHMEFLASHFPGFAAESLADVYHANGCDLNLTIEVLTQLELQGDGGFRQNLNSKALDAPSLGGQDFLELPVLDAQNGRSKYARDIQQVTNTYNRSTSSIFRGGSDFASSVKKLASHDGGHWKYERNGSTEANVGSSRTSQIFTNSYNGHGKLVYEDKSQNFGVPLAASASLDTGDALSNMYEESRVGGHDFFRLRDTYFEQGSPYVGGNKGPARELSEKGHLFNMQMKAVLGKGRETIYQRRSPASLSEFQGYSSIRGGQDHAIDLHGLRVSEGVIDLQGLHTSEAMLVLKHEITVLRSTAMSSGQDWLVTVNVGSTGHHTKNTRTPPMLQLAVEQYLLEEGLPYIPYQPGLLCVGIHCQTVVR